MSNFSTLKFTERRIALQKIRKNKRLQRIGIAIFIWILIIVYFFSPLSKANTPTVKNNVYFTKSEIINYSGLQHKKNSYLWNIKKDKAIELLKSANPVFINDAKVNVSLNGITISISEAFPVGKFDNCSSLTSATCKYLLSNGSVVVLTEIEEVKYQHLNTVLKDIIYLDNVAIYSNKYLEIAKGLSKIDRSFLDNIVQLEFTNVSSFIETNLIIFDPKINKEIKITFIDINDIQYLLNKNNYESIIASRDTECDNNYFFIHSSTSNNRVWCSI